MDIYAPELRQHRRLQACTPATHHHAAARASGTGESLRPKPSSLSQPPENQTSAGTKKPKVPVRARGGEDGRPQRLRRRSQDGSAGV